MRVAFNIKHDKSKRTHSPSALVFITVITNVVNISTVIGYFVAYAVH